MTDIHEFESIQVMQAILEAMLDSDEDITARAVARRHPNIAAASSITRSSVRAELLAEYKGRQAKMRAWRDRLAKRSSGDAVRSMADKDMKIASLERQVEVLVASHVAMIRAVGEMGGFKSWAQFYDDFRALRDELVSLHALPLAEVTSLPER